MNFFSPCSLVEIDFTNYVATFQSLYEKKNKRKKEHMYLKFEEEDLLNQQYEVVELFILLGNLVKFSFRGNFLREITDSFRLRGGQGLRHVRGC